MSDPRLLTPTQLSYIEMLAEEPPRYNARVVIPQLLAHIGWLQAKLDAMAKEPPAPRIPPDLAGALREWNDSRKYALEHGTSAYHRPWIDHSEKEIALARAIDAAQKEGWL